MQYITGIHALNLPCALNTCGDWHTSALRWEKITWRESFQSPFNDYGIEMHRSIPFLQIPDCNIANHIRALLDLLHEGNFATAQGMRDDFIGNDAYTQEIFAKVLLLQGEENWTVIDAFMEREYKLQWLQFYRHKSNLQ